MSRMRIAFGVLALIAIGSYFVNQSVADPTPKGTRTFDLMFGVQKDNTFALNDEDSDLGEAEEGEAVLDESSIDEEVFQSPADKLREMKIKIELSNAISELDDKSTELKRMEVLVKSGALPESEINELKREIRALQGEIQILEYRLGHPEADEEEHEGYEEEDEEEHESDFDDLPYEILERVLRRTEGIREEAREGLLRNLRNVIEELEGDEEDEEFDDEEGHRGRGRGGLDGLHHRLERLNHAAELLEQAGEEEQAEQLFKKAERLEQQLDNQRREHGERGRHHEGRVFDEIFKELRSIKEELQGVHQEVRELKKLIKSNKE